MSNELAIVPLGKVAELIYVGVPTKQSEIRRVGPAGNVLTVRALSGDAIDRDELVEIGLSRRDVSKYRARAGDVVLSARSTVLKTAVVPGELDGVVLNATLLGIRCLPKLDPQLLVAYLRHPEGAAALESVAQSATLQMNITAAALGRVGVPVPPLEVQRHLAEILAAAEEACAAAEAVLRSRRRLARQVFLDYVDGKLAIQ